MNEPSTNIIKDIVNKTSAGESTLKKGSADEQEKYRAELRKAANLLLEIADGPHDICAMVASCTYREGDFEILVQTSGGSALDVIAINDTATLRSLTVVLRNAMEKGKVSKGLFQLYCDRAKLAMRSGTMPPEEVASLAIFTLQAHALVQEGEDVDNDGQASGEKGASLH